uniref:Tc1-like transposase DDE domain-containing protein n=1 Tax=Cyprinus carpio carpio TaxID=630221 RepID=A0A9J8AJQ7_CYPCA
GFMAVWPNSLQVEGTLSAAKYRDSLNENPVQSIQKLRLDADFIFQQDLAPAHTAKSTKIWLNDHDNSVNVLEWPSQSLGLNSVKYFWRNLKMCICPIQPDRA